MRLVLFILGTWGVILAVPIIVAWALWAHLGPVAAVVGCVLLTVGIVMGEWLAPVMNVLLDGRERVERHTRG